MESVGAESEGKAETRGEEEVAFDDRRAANRFVCARPHTVRIMVRPAMLSYPGFIHNFTQMGIGLSVQHPFEIGTILAIQLRIAKAGLSSVLSATVTRCQAEGPGAWFLGCKLSRPLSHEEMLALC
jgi:hypothetical protein